MSFAPKLFLSLLVRTGLFDQATADKYEVESLQKNIPIDEYLLTSTSVDKKTILKTKAALLHVPYVDVANTPIDSESLSLIPEPVARRFTILPYTYDQNQGDLYVATSDPLNPSLTDFLLKKTGKRIILSLANQADIIKAINLAYTQGLSPEVSAALKDVMPAKTKVVPQMLNTGVNEAPVAKIVNTVLEFAIKSRASDVHIEPQETKTRVRYRIDGLLQEKLALPRGLHESLVSRIKILSEMKIDEKRVPQDGRFAFRINSEEVDLRVSTLPTVHGEKIVMRLLKKTGGLPTLNDLGLRGTQLKDLEDAITKPYGIILVTGPTGSGKTTTLYSILSRLNKPNVNISTLEDPVEYQISGINQVQINPQAGLTFATGLRAFLRQDPNIILVGEIRDADTTQLAIQAALTGHLVFATLHTNDAATAIPRLIDLGAEPFLIASVVNASAAQRITRKICENCKEVYEPAEEIKENIKLILGDLLPKQYRDGTKTIQIARGKGCNECGMSGYLGRIAIFEVIRISPTLNKMILQESSAKALAEEAKKEGLIDMKQDGYLKVLEGITTIQEVLRVAEI